MSRVGRAPVKIPANVRCELNNATVKVFGPKGSIENTFGGAVRFEVDGDTLRVRPLSNERAALAMWGTARTIVKNMVLGVTEGFSREVRIYPQRTTFFESPSFLALDGGRVELSGKRYIRLQLKPSRNTWIQVPDHIEVDSVSQAPHPSKAGAKITLVKFRCMDKGGLGVFMSKLIMQDPVHPYHDVGIRYTDQKVFFKAVATKKKEKKPKKK